MQKNNGGNKMGTEPVFKLLVTMSMPAMLSMIVQALYNIVDSIFVARISSEAFTAISLVFPVQILMISFAVGTGIGLNSLISRNLGAGDINEASKVAEHGIFLGVVTGVAFAILGVLFTKPFFMMFTENQRIIELGSTYTYIITIFSVGLFIHVCSEKTLQATGNMIYPMIMQLVGAIINIVLDPILIFGLFGAPKMGVAGAAIATIIGQITAMFLSLYILFAKNHEIKIRVKGFRPNACIIKNIYRVGIPSIVMQSIGSFVTVVLNSILIQFSDVAVNVLGIYYKLQSFVTMPLFGICQGLMPIVGYNYGAKNKQRLILSVKYAMIIGIAIMGTGTLIFNLFPDKLLSIFDASQDLYDIGVPALKIISLAFIGAAVGILLSTVYQAVGNGFYSLIVSLLRQLILIIPFAYIMSDIIGIYAIWLSIPFAEYISIIVSVWMCFNVYKHKIKDL